MSGSILRGIGLATVGLGLAQRGAALLFGGAGPVVLGEVTFDGFEVPESIAIGGAQHLAVHRLPGGARVIDAMGRDDAPIGWSGTFLGPAATLRALAVDEMRIDGRPVALLFGAYYYTVVIESFKAEYRREAHIPYQISCVVLRDESAAPAMAMVTTAMQVAGDIAEAAFMVGQLASPPPMPARAGGVALPAPAVALAAAQAASEEAAREGFRRGAATQAACAAALAVARASVGDGLAGAGAALATATQGAAPGGIVANVASFVAAIRACEQMARMGAALGATARAEQNAAIGSV